MATATSKPEMPTFSYAQAARGISAAPTMLQPAKSTPADQTRVASQETNGNQTVGVEVNALSSRTEPHDEAEKTESGADQEPKPTMTTQQPAVTDSPKLQPSGTSSPSNGITSIPTLLRDDDIGVKINGVSDVTWDRESQASGQGENPSNSVGEGGKEDPSNPPSEKNSPLNELKAAPIPVVNVWQQRKEAQEAKAKANAAVLKSAISLPKIPLGKPPNVLSQASTDHYDLLKAGGKKKTAETSSDSAGLQGKDRKRLDGGKARDESVKKLGNRASRPGDGGGESVESALPPVGDTTAWPTPQTAQGEEKKKAQEKGEKPERAEKSPVIRPHGKEKWMPVAYVPTPVFNTPLPSAARRGGRSRGGRESSRGGAFVAPANGGTDKGVTGHTAQSSPVTIKQSGLPDKGRNEHNSGRATSLPAQARRSNSADAAPSSEQRRPFQATDRSRSDGRTKGFEDSNTSTHGLQTTSGETIARHHRDNKYLGKNPESSGPAKSADHHFRNANLSSDVHNGSRFNSNHERRFENGHRSGDYPRDSASFSGKDRENKDIVREKGEYHRDREHPRERGDSRPERGRGGYRGRGSHSYGSSQHSQFSNSQLSQHSFMSPKPFGFNTERQRSHQHGYQNGSQTHNPNHRLSLRSPSLPSSGAPFNPYPLPEINTMFTYPQVPPGPVTAIPYQAYQESFPLVGMISMQLEYYFSVDNLCKDLFLRKHMNSQGFVRLAFIATFKRIKTLTEDLDLLRHVCRQLRTVEYQAGEDGVDRLRPREKWEQWVLSIEQRDSSAQNDGPPPPKPVSPIIAEYHDTFAPVSYPGSAPLTNGLSQDGPHGFPTLNGVKDSHVTKTSLSSKAPEFTPFVPLAVQNENANIGKPIDYNAFPDDQVENLVIVVRKPGFSSPPQPPFLSLLPRSFSHGSVDGCRTAGGTVTSDDSLSLPCSGDAASSRILENRTRRHDNLPTPLMTGGDIGAGYQALTFWLKKGSDSPIETPSDIVHESYNIFRKRALEKRELSVPHDDDPDIDVLYLFWSHFLVRNFNAKMYDEFRSLALDDYYRKGSTGGIDSLIQFYDSVLSSNRVMPDEVAGGLVHLINTEITAGERPMFDKLRSTWQNGCVKSEKSQAILEHNLRTEKGR